MKISLINPNLSTSDRYGKALGKVGPTTEPLGLAYLAAAIKQKRNDLIEIIDAAALNYSEKDLFLHLKKSNPDLVGVTVLTPMYKRAKETVELARKACPYATIILGGPHATIFPQETLKDIENADFILVGEGERTITELLNAIEDGRGFNLVKGIVYRRKGEIKITKPREYIKNLDDVPLPLRGLLPMQKYKPAPTYYQRLPSHIMLVSRGCPYHCVYCSKIFGNTYRHNSIPRVIEEMKVLIYKYKVKEIIFRDDTFTIDREFVKSLCEEIIKQNFKIKWTCMTRVNIVDEKLLNLMAKAGCWSIHYGVESGSQRLLDLIEKGIKLEQVKKAFEWTRKAGIEIKAFFMLGLPTETKEESLQTLKFIKECDADWVQVTITVPYPGTKLYTLAQQDGTLKSLKWEDYQTWAGWADKELVYVPKGRDPEELKMLQKKAMRDFYLSPKFVLRQLTKVRLYNIRMFLQGAWALVRG